MMERLTYTVSEVAELLGLSRSKTYELVAGGTIPVLAIPGRRKLVARATLQRLVEQPLSANASPTSTHHDPHDHDPSTVNDSTCPSSRPLREICSQPIHSTDALAPGVRGGRCVPTRRSQPC
jgi:excisionase family DNA binding protein